MQMFMNVQAPQFTHGCMSPTLSCYICAHAMHVHEWKNGFPSNKEFLVGHESTKMVEDYACKLFELSVPIKPITSGV